MYLSESHRNVLGIMIAVLSVIMTAFGFCVICGSVYVKLHMDSWKILFRDYNPDALFLSLLFVGCVIFVLHVYGVKHGYATGYVESREPYRICFFPLMVLMALAIVSMCVTAVLCLVHRGWLVEGFKDGMLSRIRMYKDDMTVKSVIDHLQMNYKCCGSFSYRDWFGVSWIDKEFVNVEHPDIQRNLVKGEYVTNNAPFSCCSVEIMRPCVYHKVTDYEAHYNYEEITLNKLGCSATLSKFYEKSILYPAACAMLGGISVETSINSADYQGQPSGFGDANCCTHQSGYNSRMFGRRGFRGNRNYNANIRKSISYIEDVILNQPKSLKSDKSVPLAKKKSDDKSKTTKTSTSAKSDAVKNAKPSKSDKSVIANDQSKTSNIHGNKWLRKRNSCTNGSTNKDTKTSITAENNVVRNTNPSNSDKVGRVAEEIANDQSKTSNIRTKKWLRRRKSSEDNNTNQDTKMSASAKNGAVRNANTSNSDKVGRVAEEIANDQSKTSNIRTRKWLRRRESSEDNNTNPDAKISATAKNDAVRNANPSNIDNVGRLAEIEIANDQIYSNIPKKKWLRRRNSSKDNNIDKDTKTSTTGTAENDGIRNAIPSNSDKVDRVEEEKGNDQTSNIRTKNWLGQRNSSKDNNTNQNTQTSTASENEEIRNPKPSKSVHFADEEANYQNKTNSQKEMLEQQNRKPSK